MLKSLTRIIGGDPIRREIEKYGPLVEEINALEPQMQALRDQALRGKTAEFRTRLAQGEELDDLLPEAFAVVRETAVRTLGLRHFDVQLIGGMVLHEGRIAEMKTGEGKTLVATMPIYLNALEGQGVHLVTVNDYLARRDARWMGPIFDYLGMSVGVLQEAARTENGRKAFIFAPQRDSTQEDIDQLEMVDRAQAYRADITYGTNNEFGFDYLRDNMAHSPEAKVQRGHHYAILDEVDNILIDEARTPLIISGPAQEDPTLYEQMARVVKQLRPEDFEISERDRTVSLTEIGENHVEQVLGLPLRDPDRPEDITPEQARLLGHLEQAMRAEYLFKRNKHYVVQTGRVVIVDEFTGRLMAGRRWSDGLHQAVEAKEGVKVRQENVTYATITLQNYFRMYDKLAGMTGTAVTEAEEFNKIYQVDVTPLPTNLEYIAMQPDTDLVEVEYREDGSKFQYFTRPGDDAQAPVFWRRKDYPDIVYRTEESKLRSVVTDILSKHARGQPLLVGTTSVEMSEKLSDRLRAESLQNLVLTHLIRDAYMAAHEIPDDGMRVEGLEPLYEPLDSLNKSELRTFARDLEMTLNPTRPENLERLIRILELEPKDSQRLEQVLNAGIPHNVLNAKKHDEESRIIADAGALGAVTIATNMAGRGVDIKLGGEVAEEVLGAVNRVLRREGIDEPEHLTLEERLGAVNAADPESIGIYDSEMGLFRKFMLDGDQVRQVGGLHVIGSERHESRRIDNQLRGRAARQGDPGSSQFFLSLEDELMRIFGGSQVSGLMQRLNIDDAVPIAHSIVDRTIEQAQSRVEGANFDTRKHLLEYDDVLNQQREIFYGQRNRVFSKDDLVEDVDQMVEDEVESHVRTALADPEGPWKLLAWLEETQPTLNLDSPEPYPSYMLKLVLDELEPIGEPADLHQALLNVAAEAMKAQHAHLSRSVDEQLERSIERLEDQARSRVELAEMAIDGALLEAEGQEASVNPRDLFRAVESSAGLRIETDDATLAQVAEDPDRLRSQIPDMIEASLGMRVWAGLVQGVERRIGQSLGLETSLPVPIDWDQASEDLQANLEKVWSQKIQTALDEINRDLELQLGSAAHVGRADAIRLLVRMSYSQQTVFDRRTHQKVSALTPRLSYAFSSAGLLGEPSVEGLTDEVLEHLDGARQMLIRSLGEAELRRNGAAGIEAFDERIRRGLERGLDETVFAQVRTAGLLLSLPDPLREQVVQIIGQTIVTEAYRGVILSVGDRLWVDYLTEMEALRTSIGLEAYGQRDPLVQYKSRAFDMFQNLLVTIRAGVVSRLFRTQPVVQTQVVAAPPPSAAAPQVTRPPVTQGNGSGKRNRRKRHRH